jgi:hypothetical protein
MKLVANWRAVLRCAWSIRLMILAGLLSGVEVALPLLDGVNEARARDGLAAYTVTQFRNAMASKWGQEFFSQAEFLNLLKVQMR